MTLTARWNQFWSVPSSGRAEAVFRVGYAAVLLCDLIGLRSSLDLYFSAGGAHPETSLEHLYDSGVVHALHAAWIGVALGLLLGASTRIASILNLALAIYFFGLRGAAAPHGADWVAHTMAFCLVLMRSDRYLTWRTLLGRGPALGPQPGWPLRVAQLSYGSLYLTAGLSKLPDLAWRDGSAFEMTLRSPVIARIDMEWAPDGSFALSLIGMLIVLWELSFPFLLIGKRTRRGAVASALLFHIGVELALRVGWFGWFAVVFSSVMLDELFPSRRVVATGSLRPGRLARGFIIGHLVMFAWAHIAFLFAAATAQSPRALPWMRVPIVEQYTTLVARIEYFNVFPSSYLLDPVRLITYDALDGAGNVRPIWPFDATGALRPGYLTRAVREGLLSIRAATLGLSPPAWQRYAEHLAKRFRQQYPDECISELRFYRIDGPLAHFGANPSSLEVPRHPLSKVQWPCATPPRAPPRSSIP